jgi:carbohydrate-selective porin OprB
MGVITGTVMECPPDPSWSRIAPNPAMVVLLQHGRTYNSQPIVFPKKNRWSGVFKFRVQPGTYEVVSSYQGAAQTVKAKAGRKYEVSFGIIGCPE